MKFQPLQPFHIIRRLAKLVGFLALAFFLILGSSGCTDDQAPENGQEPVPTVQDTPVNQEVAPEAKEEEPVGETMPPDVREKAQDQLTKAQEAVGKAEQLLQQAPTGKGSDLALSALKKDLDSAQALLQTGQNQFQDQQFQMAQAQAQKATEKAESVAHHIEQAMNTAK